MAMKMFRKKAAARKYTKGHWGTHVQYVRKVSKGYAVYRYKKARKGKRRKGKKKKR